jgi:hypothetical protein
MALDFYTKRKGFITPTFQVGVDVRYRGGFKRIIVDENKVKRR